MNGLPFPPPLSSEEQEFNEAAFQVYFLAKEVLPSTRSELERFRKAAEAYGFGLRFRGTT